MFDRPILESDVREVRARCDEARRDGDRVAFVPTMGALHDGHLTLVEEARRLGDLVVVSVFVNPTQFGPGEDFDRYPRDLESDLDKLARRGVELVFAPTTASMYPTGHVTRVRVGGLTEALCGAHRPGHFDGVTTVVAKLFNAIGPCAAVFGRKDYQQLQVIRAMARDLDMPIEVVGVATVREADGLALSSRNAYLTAKGRERALAISRGLTEAHRLYRGGERGIGALRRAVSAPVEAAADSVDYVTAADPDTVAPLLDEGVAGDRLLLAVAAHFGTTRLIDNTVLGEDEPPIKQEASHEFR